MKFEIFELFGLPTPIKTKVRKEILDNELKGPCLTNGSIFLQKN